MVCPRQRKSTEPVNMMRSVNLISRILIVCSVAILVNITALQHTAAQEKTVYTVKPGDTFYSISKNLNVSIAELKQWNDIPAESNYLSTGQELVYYSTVKTGQALPDEELPETEVPERDEDAPPLVISQPDASGSTYLVKSGDTLFGIARDVGMSVAELKELNALSSDNIRVGQRLAVKSVSAAPVVNEFSDESSSQGRFALYTLKRSDNLGRILTQFKMTEEELQALNPDIDVNQLNRANKITVLLPPSRDFANPYRSGAGLQDLGTVAVSRYDVQSIGKSTTNGELYNPEKLTAAHSNITIGSIIFVENPANGRGIYVKINDRITGSGLKLSNKAYQALDFGGGGGTQATIFTGN